MMHTRPGAHGGARSEYAHGWYLVRFSHDLGADTVLPVEAFDRHYVLYRTAAGFPVVLDAHCPHLGAHLGYGGRVEGDEIICPFHAWRFGSSGKCSGVPYAARIPPRAEVRSYPVREHSGMILMYFGGDLDAAADPAPPYEVPVVPEVGDPNWTPLETAEIEVKTEQREVIENIADRAHFMPVHNTKIDDFQVIIDGPRATQRTMGKGRNLKGEKIDVASVATYHGPAVQFTRLGWAYPMVLINAHLPISKRRLLLRFGVCLDSGGEELPRPVIDAHVAAARNGYFEDVAIWEHKRWRDRPILAEGDGPIGKIRKWYSRFYEQDRALPHEIKSTPPSPNEAAQ